VSDRVFRLVMAALTTASVGVAAYLVYAHYTSVSVVCPTSGCETVQHSAYADVFGVPVALLGLFGSLGILLTLLRGHRRERAAGLALTVCALVFAAYLGVVQLAVIHAVCVWCVANDVILAVLASLAAWRVYDDLKAPGTGARGRSSQRSR
jgi:uncharacterized membrane protein